MRKLTKLWRRIASPSRITVRGQRLSLASPHIDAQLKRKLYRERYEVQKLRQMNFKIEPNDVVLDIGAGIGLTALYAATMVGPENVLAIEADARACEIARDNFALNHLDIDLTFAAAVPCAAHAAADTVDFYVNDELGRSSLFARAGGLEPVQVPVVDVKSVLAARDISALIVDVQGSEFALFADIDDFRAVRVILLTIHEQVMGYDRSVDLLKTLFDKGFALDFPYSRGQSISLARRHF
jgi:FkbM family methyltransferase